MTTPCCETRAARRWAGWTSNPNPNPNPNPYPYPYPNPSPNCHPHPHQVGRLDKASEGLLLFTNDTRLAHRLTSPDTHLPKVYEVRLDRPLRPAELEALGAEIDLDGELTRP